MPLRFGVLSTARIARNSHIPAAKETSACEVVAISSRDSSVASKYAQDLDIPRAYGSYEELLSDDGVDAVINPLPNSMH